MTVLTDCLTSLCFLLNLPQILSALVTVEPDAEIQPAESTPPFKRALIGVAQNKKDVKDQAAIPSHPLNADDDFASDGVPVIADALEFHGKSVQLERRDVNDECGELSDRFMHVGESI